MLKKVLFTLFLIVVFLLGLMAVKDPDLGWHLICGERILKGQSWCIDNHFSYYLVDYKFYNPSFLFDFLLAVFYKIGGLMGVALLGSAIFSSAYLLFSKSFPKKVPLVVSFIGFLAIFFLSNQTFGLGVRSQLITFWFTILFLYLIRRLEDKKMPFWVFPLVMIFWVNSHGGFFLGLILLGFYLISQIINRSKNIKLTLVILASTFAATFVNPFTYKIYIELIRHFNSSLGTIIAEWLAPPLLHKMIIGYITLGILGWLSFWWYKRRSVWEILNALIIIFFAILSFKARRNLPYFYTFSIYAFLYYIPWKWLSKKEWVSSLVILPLLIFGIKKSVEAFEFNTSWGSYCNEGVSHYPCDIVEKYPNLSGNIFNTYEWGGFLIWQYPNAKVFIDGRMPAWEADLTNSAYKDWLYVLQTRVGWNEILKKYHTDYILVGKGVFLDLLLSQEGGKYGWERVFEDKHTVFYERIR